MFAASNSTANAAACAPAGAGGAKGVKVRRQSEVEKLAARTAEELDEPIPGESYGFGVLHDAQAAGDYDVLAAHGLRVARIHITGEPEAGLARLADAFEAAVSARA